MKTLFCFLLVLQINFLIAETNFNQDLKQKLNGIDYIICVDGGGSKTELQVLDINGNLVELDGLTNSIKAGSSNINVVGINGINEVLISLFNSIKIKNSKQDLQSILSNTLFVGGFSGADSLETKEQIKKILKEIGFSKDKIIVISDSEMTLNTLPGDGIILIAGTGSIALGKKNENVFRVGGLGRFIGDEGSGYYIGIRALRAALEDEFGWGQKTSLKLLLRDYFNILDLRDVVTPFYKGEISNQKIAGVARIVFEQADEGDLVALKIIDKAAKKLGQILQNMIDIVCFKETVLINLFGGIFKSINVDFFIQKILKEVKLKNCFIENKAKFNPTVLAVQNVLKS